MTQRFIPWILAAIGCVLPLGTRWIIAAGDINGGYWEYGTISIYASEVLIWIAALVSLRSFLQKRVRQPKIITATILLAGFVIFVFHNHNFAWLIHGASAAMLGFLLWYHCAHRTMFLTAFACSMAVQSGLGIWQVVSQQVSASTLLGTAAHVPQALGASVVMYHGERLLRAYGTLPHPNIFGAYAVIGLLATVTTFTRQSTKKYWHGGVAAVCVVGALLSFSRAAWAGVLIVAILSVVQFKRHSFAMGIMIALILFAAVFHGTIVSRLTASGALETRSVIERVSSVHEAWQLFTRHPIRGVGGGNYTRAVHDELDSTRPSWAYQPVHNSVLLVIAEFGIAGFLIIAGFLYFKRKYIGYSCVVLLPFIVFDHFLWSIWPGLALFGLVCGAVLVDTQESLDSSPKLS